MSHTTSGESRTYVGCGVTNCSYHGDGDICRADSIQVESPNAVRKGETYCSTFKTSCCDTNAPRPQ
jgi:hypothetical protein